MGSVIRIQEQSVQSDGFHAVVSFDYGPQYPITVRDPFDQKQEAEVEWYFEQHLEFPFTQKVRARKAAASIATYGEVLFKHVFLDNKDVYAEFKALLKVGLEQVQIEVTGSPKFHALHWEALKDPELAKSLALQAMMVRRNMQPPPFEVSVQPGPTINLLIVTARPYGMKDVSYRTISRPLVDALRQTDLRVNIDILRPGTYKMLENHLRETTSKHGAGYYHVIHFDLHGSLLSYILWQSLLEQKPEKEEQSHSHTYQKYYALTDIPQYTGEKAFLFFEGEQDDSVTPVEASALANMLRDHHIPVAILNACQSGKQIGDTETSLGSSLMQAGVQLVLAMGYSITVSGAVLLMTTLYQHLFAGNSLSLAIRHARNELANQKKRRAYYAQWIDLEDWLLPVVYQNRPVQLTLRDLTLEENKAYHEHKAELERITPPEPTYGFIGRDLDILQIEKRLLTKRNLLLLRGMGGAGKTTLLRHLNAWWRTTGLIEHVFYFGYDERAWNRQQIIVEIAQQLLDPVAYVRDFQPLSLDAQQAKLASTLRAHRYLLILDNLESITGANLAILHTLDKTEQEALRRFLAALVGGKTLILLGSRGGEDWLAKGTFVDNVYDLPGLDPEAASTLADLILEQHDATKYRQDKDLRHLLNLLDGFPLALEVVLPNLAHQTPKEVLEALQAGDVELDTGNQEDKTKSILRCIDYSHSNLSPEAQQLLLCLAPFTSVIDQEMLENYTAQLKQQPALASLPFERWPEVLQEAANWGLLSPDPAIPRFLRLQPIFPYFLRNRLDTAELSPMRASVETAFRLHYDQLGDALYGLLKSKEPQKRQVGQVLTSLEYTNLSAALYLALTAQVSILNLYNTLSDYLDSTQEQQRGLDLGQSILKRLETYPAEKLAGMLGVELVSVIDRIANWQSLLKRPAEAEVSYRKALAIWLENKSYEADEIKKRKLAREDIQLLSSRDALVAFFAKIGYDTNDRLVQNVAAMGFSSDNLKSAITHIERLASQDGRMFEVYLFELKSVTIATTQGIVRAFRNRPGDYLLVLTDDFQRLDVVLVERYSAEFPRPQETFGLPSAAKQVGVRPRILTVHRRNPDDVALRVLRRFSYTESDTFAQYEKLLSAYDVADWSEPFFNNRTLFSDYYLTTRLPDSLEWKSAAEAGAMTRAFRQLRELYADVRETFSNQPEEVVRARLLEPVVAHLGFTARSVRASNSGTPEPDYRLYPTNATGQATDKPLALCLAYTWGRNLDGKDEQRDSQTPDENPGAVVVTLLDSGEADWAIVTNGKTWRLYAAKAHSRATNYYEIDLEETLAQSPAHLEFAFRYFWLFFRSAAFIPAERFVGGEKQLLCFLDSLMSESERYARELGERLKERIFFEIFPHFARPHHLCPAYWTASGQPG